MMMFNLIDINRIDYFKGYHKPVIQVQITGNMTCKEVAEEIISEYNCCYDLYESLNEKLILAFCEKLKSEEGLYYDCSGVCDVIDPENPVYLFFSEVNPVNAGGVVFLDS